MIFLIPVLLGVLLSGYGVYSWSRVPWSTDTLLYVLPDFSVNSRILEKGFLPLWNAYLGGGLPQLAGWLSSCLYPPSLLLNLSGWNQALIPLTLLHVAWAYGGAYLWLRSQKSSIGFSLLGALSFAGSAHFIRCWLNTPFVFTLSWIPWIFWSFEKTLEKPRSSWWVLTSLFLSLQILAGYPFFVFYTWILLGGWFLYRRPSRPQWKSILKPLGLALSLTSVQWIPFLEFLLGSVRGDWERYPYFTQPIECLTLLQPTLAGDPSNFSYQGSPANGNFGNLYFGLIPFLIFIGGWLTPRDFQNRFWNFSALGFFLWILGPHFPLLSFLPQRWTELIDPSKAVGLFLFCACTSAATTGTRFFENKTFRKKFWNPWLAAGGILWTLDLLLLPHRLLHWVPNPYLNSSIHQTWTSFAPQTEGFRVLSLQSPRQWTFTSLENFPLENAALLMMNSNEVWGIRSVNGYLSTQTQTLHNLAKYIEKGFPYGGDLLDVAGVKFLMLPQIPPGGKYKILGRLGEDYLLLNPKAAPRGWAVSNAKFFPDHRRLLESLSGTGNPWRQSVFLEQSSGGPSPALAAPSRKLTASLPEPDRESRMSFNTETPVPGYWVFNETWAPGWHAWVDGMPAPILRADGLFMAVKLPLKGRHQVDFRYEPASFRLGLFLFLLALPAGGAGFVPKRRPV